MLKRRLVMNRKDWNPELYLKFNEERTRPAIDLAANINVNNPKKIIDIGCGPGNSTQVLFKKWPESKIVGIDNSASMIKSAKKSYPKMEWQIEDATKMEKNDKYDVIFSNSTIQWIKDQEKLIKNFFDMLEEKGALAMQIPLFHTMPASNAIENVLLKQKWKEQTRGANNVFNFQSSGFYYDLLSEKTKSIDIWETSYIHIMPSHQYIVEMLKSAGIRPFLDKLDNEKEKIEFEHDIFKEITKAYPSQKDGNILFPFKRLFFIGYKS